MTSNPQKAKKATIPVIFAKNSPGAATIHGNNAAWMCVCGYHLPLIWSHHLKLSAKCAKCGSIYEGIGNKNVEEIKEIDTK